DELATLAAWAAEGAPLVTITGSAGVGKTRLAIEHVLGGGSASGPALLVDVGGASAAGGALASVAQALGVDIVGQAADADVAAAIAAWLAAHDGAVVV